MNKKCGSCGHPADDLKDGSLCPSCKQGVICSIGSFDFIAHSAAMILQDNIFKGKISLNNKKKEDSK